MESKKAQNLSITTIILIILGVVVLVVLIIGFTQGWGSVKGFFTGGTGSGPQVESLCNIACTTEDVESWCITEREGGTCDDLAAQGKFVECFALKTKCPTKKCVDQPGNVNGNATLCDTAIHKACPKGTDGKTQYLKGDFTDTVGGKVCCTEKCVEAPSPEEV